jgi:hypothetical protein
MGTSKPKEDLQGITVKNWIVEKYIGKGKWLCTCKECNRQEEFRAYHLKDNRVRMCTHSDCKEIHSFKNDLTNLQFGELYVVGFDSSKGKWICKCSCGNEVEHSTYELTTRGVKSCGHSTNKLTDLTEKQFGELKVIEYTTNGKWLCECSCGNKLEVNARDLKSGNTKSCGHTRGLKRIIDLKGKQFGELTAIEYLGNSFWNCKCSCGKETAVHSYSLRNNLITTCGDAIHKVKDISNQRFGELTAIEYIGNGVWKCKCSCGNIKNILGANLRNGSTKSCGCITDKLLKQTLLAKYGEICSSRASNPRTQEQIEILSDKELFEQFIKNYTDEYGKPTSNELAELLNVDRATIQNKARQYELTELILVNSNISYEEKQLQKYIMGITQCEVITNTKNIVDGYELDIYIPDMHLAFEFNGTYWHSEEKKDKYYHQHKTIVCAQKGIQLIHIFEYEWCNIEKQERIKKYIKSILNTEKTQIYARETTVKLIENIEEKKDFLNTYHLQGDTTSSINIGCYYKDELIGVLTLGKPRFNNNYEYEIIRYCWKPDIVVTGGLEKMFSYFLKYYNPTSIITYSDISKFTGNCYIKIGFKPVQSKPITEPNYVWVEPHNNDVLTRYQTMKQKLINEGLGTKEQTEDEIMENLNFLKVYDSGNIKLEWTRE